MAARLNPRHSDAVKSKIQGSQLVNRLQNHALGKAEMSASQVQSAKILLDKIISNAPTTIAGDPENPIAFTEVVMRGVKA